MAKRIVVVCQDDYLYQKIHLALRNKATVERGVAPSEDGAVYVLEHGEGVVGGKGKILLGVDLPLPFTYEELENAIANSEVDEEKILTRGSRCVYLRGEKIPLTEVEFTLLSTLMDANGEYVSRDELMQKVWQGEADGGVLNVYIHYLRGKIERGEKIILSSRSYGYKIDRKYL